MNMNPNSWTGSIHLENEQIDLSPFRSGSHDSLYHDLQFSDIQQGRSKGIRVQWTLHPKQATTLHSISFAIPFTFSAQQRLLANGFQSWSLTREVRTDERFPAMRRIAKRYFQYYGDEYIPLTKEIAPHPYSWSLGYVRSGLQQMTMLGSLNEQFAYTLIEYNTSQQQLVVHLDVAGLHLQHSLPILDLVIIDGPESEVRAIYQSLQALPPLPAPAVWGWNSWYHFYTDINPTKISKALQSVAASEHPFEVFQLDDGYQAAIGDWLVEKPAFQGQMPQIAQQIETAGLRPGLWLAPMVVEEKAQIAQKNPDWLLQNSKGKPIRVGYNPLWGGWYYALNFYDQGVQNYLTQVFQTVTRKWGYQFLKLDFLFAACIAPPAHKTRAQVMSEVLDFIRRLCPDTQLLGCGVPLASAAGRMEYCRIGPDIHLDWDHKLLRFFRKRERVSTDFALQTILGRWWLDGLWFGNDPDVFIMRTEGHRLTPEIQRTLLLVTAIFGRLHFTSDLPAAYDEWGEGELKEALFWSHGQVQGVRWIDAQKMDVRFSLDDRSWKLLINWSQKHLTWPESPHVQLAPGESIILRNA